LVSEENSAPVHRCGSIFCSGINIDKSENFTAICKHPTTLLFLSQEGLDVIAFSQKTIEDVNLHSRFVDVSLIYFLFPALEELKYNLF
jgi:hypothetical protein